MIRILLVDDHPIVRDGLAIVLEAEPEFTVVGAAASVAEARRLLTQTAPDVLLLDLILGDGSGVELLPKLRAAHPNVRVLIFTAFDADDQILSAVRAGARGYLLKGASSGEIARAIRTVHAGGSYFAPNAAAAVIAALAEKSKTARAEQLTPREKEVLRHVAQGLSNKQIARALTLSERTVKFHLSGILRKLSASSRAQAAVLALQRHLLD